MSNLHIPRAHHAQELTKALGGHWYGTQGLAFCPAHPNKNTPALSLKQGDDGRLLAYCHSGCSFEAVMAALKARGFDTQDFGRDLDPILSAQRAALRMTETEKRARQARAIWDAGVTIEGSPAESYLRGRGITCGLPDTLRFVRECWHPTGKRLPAMIARIDGAQSFAVHRTYLMPSDTYYRKAQVNPAKAMLGSVAGGGVRVTNGPGPLVIAEGIETALSLASGLLDYPARICAALSTSGMKGLSLPSTPGELVIAIDGDDAGKLAAHKLAERATFNGWKVSLAKAPDGLDWNDVLMTQKAGM